MPKWVPFQRKAAYGREMIETHVTIPYDRVKEDIVSFGVFPIPACLIFSQAAGRAGPSLTRDILTSLSKDESTPKMEERIKWTTGMSITTCVLVPTHSLRSSGSMYGGMSLFVNVQSIP